MNTNNNPNNRHHWQDSHGGCMNEPRQGWHLREVYFNDGEPTMHREPQQRQWVGLSDDDIAGIEKKFGIDIDTMAAEAIEAKLREKNT